jgi:hypothetical protein
MNLDNLVKLKECDLIDDEVGLFRGPLGNYCVVMREGKRVKGIPCVGFQDASVIFDACVDKLIERSHIN